MKKHLVPADAIMGEKSKKKEKILLKEILKNQEELASQISDLRAELIKLRMEMRQTIREEVIKEIGDKISMIDATLTETIIHKEILIDKGILTREEVNNKLRQYQQ